MTKSHTKSKTIFKTGLAVFALAMPFVFAGSLPTKTIVSSATTLDEYLAPVTITNGSFDDIDTLNAENDVTGWTRKYKNTGAKTMIVDVSNRFSEFCNGIYFLPANVSLTPTLGDDSKILMINYATSSPTSSSRFIEKKEAYISNDIPLNANSYYEFSVSMKSMAFYDDSAFGSICISGLKDENGNEKEFGYVEVSSSTWHTYNFFIPTGSQSQTITIDLWLGSEQNASTGAVFFDEVVGTEVDEASFYYDYQYLQNEGKTVKIFDKIDTRNIVDTSNLNFDFEKSLAGHPDMLVDWVEENKSNAKAMILPLDNENFKSSVSDTTLSFPGSDFSNNNTQAMFLWANDGFVSVKSKTIEIPQLALYKVTMKVKTLPLSTGAFTFTIRETDAITKNFDVGSYEPMQAASSAISNDNQDNGKINYYNELSMYVKGHARHNSEFEILLNLGTSDSKATGGVVIDNIIVEAVDYDEFSAATGSLVLSTSQDDTMTIANGDFSKAKGLDKNLEYPAQAEDWTIEQSSSEAEKKAGIINIYQPYFDSYDFDWSRVLMSNPGSPDPNFSTDDVNNVMMLYNSALDNQSMTSAEFEFEAESYYVLSFRYKTVGEKTTNFNVNVLDSDGAYLLADEAVHSSNWETYTCYIYGGEADTNAKIKIEFGTKEAPVDGFAFFDNFELVSCTEEDFENAKTKIDLSNFRLNLDPKNEIGHNLSSSASFTSSGDTVLAGGGIVKGKNNDVFAYVDDNGEEHFIDYNAELENNVLVLFTKGASSHTLTSKVSLSAEQGSYYILKFKLLTSFPGYHGTHEHDDEKDIPFGAKVGIENFDMIENLQSNNGWQEFSIYFSATEEKTCKFVFSLESDCLVSAGYAYLTDLSWTKTNADAFANVESKDGFGKTIFTSTVSSSDTDNDSSSDTDTNENNQTSNIDDTLWLLIPSLIMAVALIVAIVGFAVRHVKIKKTEKARKEEYDRDETLHNDMITNQAKEIQNAEIEQLNKQIQSYKDEIAELEKENQNTIALSRDKGKVTSEVEKQFRSFAQKRAKIEKNIDQLNEQLSFISSADYLLTIVKRVKNQKAAESKKAEKVEDKKTKKAKKQ